MRLSLNVRFYFGLLIIVGIEVKEQEENQDKSISNIYKTGCTSKLTWKHEGNGAAQRILKLQTSYPPVLANIQEF